MGACVSAQKEEEEEEEDSSIKPPPPQPPQPSQLLLSLPVDDKQKQLIEPLNPPTHSSPNKLIHSRRLSSSSSSPRSLATFTDGKEETYFDSQAWLESDYEEDFMSVNGEFTPSRGSTPVHHSFSAGKPKINPLLVDQTYASLPEQSSTGNLTRLSDLFEDSLRVNPGFELQNLPDTETGTRGVTEPNSTPGSPFLKTSVISGEFTPNGSSKVKRLKSVQHCFPSVLSCSFSERKTKMKSARGIE